MDVEFSPVRAVVTNVSELPALRSALLSCPSCRGGLLEETDAWKCQKCAARYPVRYGVTDFRDPVIDKTAGFALERDLEAAAVLNDAYAQASYFELYDLYCRHMEKGSESLDTPRRQKAEAAYRQTLKETHLLHGNAILQKLSLFLEDRGSPFPKTHVAVEDGAGLGQFVYGFSKKFRTVLVVDLSLSYLILCRKLLDEHQLDNVFLLCANVERLPIREGVADFVHFNNMIEHVLNPAAALAEAHRVLAQESLLLVVSPNRHSLYVEPHFQVPAFGCFPRWAQRKLAWLLRGVRDIEGVHLYSLRELRSLLRGTFGTHYSLSFLPRHLPSTVRDTFIRRMVVRTLKSRVGGSLIHVLFNKIFLAVMPYHVGLCFKQEHVRNSR